MSKQPPLNDRDRADLVAYLDGELPDAAARAMEARLALDPVIRAEAESLKRAWDLLDFLPRKEPSPNFTSQTLSRVGPHRRARPRPPAGWKRWALPAGWAAGVLAAGLAGFLGVRAFQGRGLDEDRALARDLRLIENKRHYDLAEDVEFLEALDHPDLFGGDDGSGS